MGVGIEVSADAIAMRSEGRSFRECGGGGTRAAMAVSVL